MTLLKMNEIEETLAPLENKYEVVLYGSQIKGGTRPSSDIDVAVITRNSNQAANIEIQNEILGTAPLKYDLRVFELLPIYIQISIISNYKVIFGDPLEISEYFYSFRKIWEDCKHRILSNQFKDFHEYLSLQEKEI